MKGSLKIIIIIIIVMSDFCCHVLLPVAYQYVHLYKFVSRTKILCVAVHHPATNNVMEIRAGIHSTDSCNSSLALTKKI